MPRRLPCSTKSPLHRTLLAPCSSAHQSSRRPPNSCCHLSTRRPSISFLFTSRLKQTFPAFIPSQRLPSSDLHQADTTQCLCPLIFVGRRHSSQASIHAALPSTVTIHTRIADSSVPRRRHVPSPPKLRRRRLPTVLQVADYDEHLPSFFIIEAQSPFYSADQGRRQVHLRPPSSPISNSPCLLPISTPPAKLPLCHPAPVLNLRHRRLHSSRRRPFLP